MANQNLLRIVEEKWQQTYGPAVNASTVIPNLINSPHDVIEAIPLKVVLEDFLLTIQVKDPRDAEQHNAMLVGLANLLANNSNMVIDVFLMNKLLPGYRTRVAGRQHTANHSFAPINQYFSQSAGIANDRKHCSSDKISLQLRRFDLGTQQRDHKSADIKAVTWFALNVPTKLRQDLLIESRD